jgi:hypothetical protein
MVVTGAHAIVAVHVLEGPRPLDRDHCAPMACPEFRGWHQNTRLAKSRQTGLPSYQPDDFAGEHSCNINATHRKFSTNVKLMGGLRAPFCSGLGRLGDRQ